MMISFIANVGAVVVDLTPDYAKPGDTIQVLSYEIVGPMGGTNLTGVHIGYSGTDLEDVEYAELYIDDNLIETLYGPEGELEPGHFIPEGVTVTVRLEFKIRATAAHGNQVDGYVTAYTTSKPGAEGTDPQPIDPEGYTIIDDEKPFVVDATAYPDPAKAGPVTMDIEFSEAMDMGVAPTVTVTGLNSSYTVVGSFQDPDTWAGLLILIDEDEEGTAYISVSGGKDLAGNEMDPAPTAGSFQVDTIGPNVVPPITVSHPEITDADIGNLFEITVTYNENMDMSVHPTISLNPDVTATLPSLTGSWDDGTHYVLSCLIADGNQEVAHVGVNINGAQDIVGNLQGSVEVMSLFAIDNKNPTVDITVSDDMISDADVPGPFEVTATFSEAMDKSVLPAISFTPDISAILTAQSGIWDVDGMVYTANYTIFDGNLDVSGVDVTVSGAQDLAGNNLVSKSVANLFSIDMLAPPAPAIIPPGKYINIANQDAYLVSGFAEPGSTVEVRLRDGLGVNATATGLADAVSGQFTIAVDASGLNDGDVSIDANATDAAGNTGLWSVPPITVIKDTVIPTGSIVINGPINLNNVATVPVIITSNELGSYNYIISDESNNVETGFGDFLVIPIVIFNEDLSALVDGTITAHANIVDEAGNVGEAWYTATKDTVKPEVTGFQVSGILISEADALGTFEVNVTFSEAMGSDPIISFAPDVTATLTSPSSSWSEGNTKYTVTYTIVDVDEEFSGVDVHVSGGSDLVGNIQVPFTASQVFNVDTIAPIPYMPPIISLVIDADINGIANIGDTLNVMVDMMNAPDTVSVTADLEAYGGSGSEDLIPGAPVWTLDFVIVDGPTGIDVGPDNLTSAVTITATDLAGNIATELSNNLVEPVDSEAPEPPTGLTATAIAGGKIRLDWTASVAPDLASYIIYRNGTEIATVGPVESWTDDPLVYGLKYHYRMRSVDDADNLGDYSEEASATSDSTPPIAPTLDAPGYINIANQNAYPVSGLAEPGSTVNVGLTDGVGFANATGSADAVSGQFTIAVDASGLNDGDVNISARATDTVGNTGLWSAPPITVIKDTVEPTVTITIPEYINLSNVEAVSVNITSDEDGTYSYDIDGITGSGPISNGVPIELLLNLSGLPDGPVTADASVEDAAGNVGHAEQDTATKDTVAPTVTIAIPEYVNLANVAEVPVIITSDEDGTYSYDIDGISGGGPISNGVPIELLLNLNSLPDGPVTADASVEDAAGNVGHAEQDTATKDTVEPIAVDFHVSDILINDVDVPGPFEVIVNFSETMDTTFVPDIDFIPSVSSTLDFTGDLWSDLDTVYTATFEIFDAGVEVLHVNLTIAGFVDIAGNFAFEQKNGTDVFDIDTKNPTVIGLEISDLWIREDDLPGPLTVTVNFSEPMSVAPNIGFNPDVSMTLLFDSDDWSVDSTVYTANYTIADVDEEASGIAITVEDAEDIAGNLQVQYATDALFEIDTLHTTSKPVSIEVKANGEDSITVEIVDDVQLVATVLNWFGEPVSDEVLVLFETNFGTIYPDIVLTEDGEAETPISSTGVGTANVNATVDGISDSCTVTFVEQTFEIQLSLGWNLISVPRTLAYPAIEEVFAGITTIEKVWTYQNGEWYGAKYENGTLTPIPGYLLEEIDDGKGYWIYTSEPVNITIKLKPLEYLALPPTYPLSAEWNLIGYTSIPLDEWMPIDSYLVYVEWSTLYRFGPYTYEIAKPGFYKYFDNFELGRGYWIHLNEEGTLVP